jgi:hypothetical protein
MGIYVISAKAIKELLLSKFPSANDFGNEVGPGGLSSGSSGEFCGVSWQKWASREIAGARDCVCCQHAASFQLVFQSWVLWISPDLSSMCLQYSGG